MPTEGNGGPTNCDTLRLRLVGYAELIYDTVTEIPPVWSVETRHDTVAADVAWL
jgi:hypothetical protein